MDDEFYGIRCRLYKKTRSRLYVSPALCIIRPIFRLTKGDIAFIVTACENLSFKPHSRNQNIMSYVNTCFMDQPCPKNIVTAACRFSFRFDDDVAIIYDKRRHCVSLYDSATQELLMEEFVR